MLWWGSENSGPCQHIHMSSLLRHTLENVMFQASLAVGPWWREEKPQDLKLTCARKLLIRDSLHVRCNSTIDKYILSGTFLKYTLGDIHWTISILGNFLFFITNKYVSFSTVSLKCGVLSFFLSFFLQLFLPVFLDSFITSIFHLSFRNFILFFWPWVFHFFHPSLYHLRREMRVKHSVRKILAVFLLWILNKNWLTKFNADLVNEYLTFEFFTKTQKILLSPKNLTYSILTSVTLGLDFW